MYHPCSARNHRSVRSASFSWTGHVGIALRPLVTSSMHGHGSPDGVSGPEALLIVPKARRMPAVQAGLWRAGLAQHEARQTAPCCPPLQIVLEELVDELEVSLPTIHPASGLETGKHRTGQQESGVPRALIVEEAISALFVVLGDLLGFFVPLEPSLILFVEAPTLVFERAGRQPLLVGVLSIVKNAE
jgi:hypothetical protein